MKKIMISIRPEWVKKILNKEKTIEIRKSFPKCELPCEVYIYCTKGTRDANSKGKYQQTWNLAFEKADKIWDILNGKVVAKFTLKKFVTLTYVESHDNYKIISFMQQCKSDYNLPTDFIDVIGPARLTTPEIEDYGKGKDLYGWYIDDLEFFDEPKELKDFGLTKAPQSWCYIKEQ